ncbi:hypothetical protein EWM64_g6734 [Hericium alpestre]|uniref:Ubiquitin-like protease family profile domain-containing protein n=1 Tax=Hericium alpestre TaxID=135208 RepID=A0A4Y9ZUX2_9AGAM|nr:hypothetical protein EWM64_g6734 [Hericium alpestre]
MADIDTTLESIQPPDTLLAQLKPDPSISVAEFLTWHQPDQPGSRKWNLPTQEWYSQSLPTAHPTTVHDLTLPSSKLCENLDSDLRKAVLAGDQSVQHPTTNGVYLPLWITRAWKWANVLVQKQTFWDMQLKWVERTAEEEEWVIEFKEYVTKAILKSPWHSGLAPIERGAVSTTTLAWNLLSTKWLNDESVDSLLEVVRTENNKLDAGVAIARTALADDIIKVVPSGWAYASWGQKLASGEVKKLLMPFNVDNIHWIAAEVDATNSIVNIGDSAPHVIKRYLPNITKRILQWLEPWNPRKPAKMRGFYYACCINIGTASGDPIMDTDSFALHLHGLLEKLSDEAQDLEAERQDIAYQTDSDGDCDKTVGLGKVSTGMVWDLKPAVSRVGREQAPDPGAMTKTKTSIQKKHKKPKVERPSQAKKAPTREKQGSKSEIVKAVINAVPPWFTDDDFVKFKKKVIKLDPKAEFSSRDPRLVRCGRCGKWTEVRYKNSMDRFKEHRQLKRCQATKIDQPSLSVFFPKSSPAKPKSEPSHPCPGLGYTTDPHITIYLTRTAAPCGGVPHRSTLKVQVLRQAARMPPHPGLSKRCNVLKPEALQKRILAAERAQAKWINDHFIGAVFSAKCLHHAAPSLDSRLISPCAACISILGLKVFRNALRRPMPFRKNAKFTPKTYRNELLGKAFQRHTDVQELMEMDEGQSHWLVFAKRGASGRYKNQAAFLGMMEAIMKIEDRRFRGKGLMNMKYDAEFDSICTNIALISPQAYRILQAEYGGRTLRSIQIIQQKHGRFQPGIIAQNVDAVLQWAKDLNYHGPLLLAVDDTKITIGLRSYRDGPQWKVGGMHGAVVPFTRYPELIKLRETKREDLADKTRLWLAGIPLPGIPPKIVATMPIHSKVAKAELRRWHTLVEERLQERGLHHISYNVDGVSIECGLTHDIQDEASVVRPPTEAASDLSAEYMCIMMADHRGIHSWAW